ncbi:MAG: carboxypeptidase-like regulatory domain-containing protein [Gelidibacter sp.]
MEKIKYLYFIIGFFYFENVASQTSVQGKIFGTDEVEGIHVINKTESKFTITNSNGEFTIPVKLYDTLVFSGVSYKLKEVLINETTIKAKTLTVYLEEQINALDEVVIGKILTGQLDSDIENLDAKRAINFYDLGIPGYVGKPKTQSERRLNEATTGGGIVPLNPLINAISGRTKMLKNQIKLEKQDVCMNKIKSDFSDLLFQNDSLDEASQAEFFYYVSEDEQFSVLCKLNQGIKTLEFLKQKLKTYKTNLQNKKE